MGRSSREKLQAALKQDAPVLLILENGEEAVDITYDLVDIMEGPLALRTVSSLCVEASRYPQSLEEMWKFVQENQRSEASLLYFHAFEEYPQELKDVVYAVVIDRALSGNPLPRGCRVVMSVSHLNRLKPVQTGADTYQPEPATIIDQAFLNHMYQVYLGGQV